MASTSVPIAVTTSAMASPQMTRASKASGRPSTVSLGIRTSFLVFGPAVFTHRPGTAERNSDLSQVIKINAITVPEGSGDELGRRFAARAGAVDDQEGFEGFELLKPTDGRTTWLVITRWRDEESFQAWVNSPAFGHGHQGADRPAPHGGPVSVSSELWSYEVSTGSPGHGG
jgi:heme-degrading monooxygenase HmoA